MLYLCDMTEKFDSLTWEEPLLITKTCITCIRISLTEYVAYYMRLLQHYLPFGCVVGSGSVVGGGGGVVGSGVMIVSGGQAEPLA